MILLGLFAALMVAAWGFAFHLRSTLTKQSPILGVDLQSVVEVEKTRNLIESQIANRRAYFVLGSSKLFEAQKEEQSQLENQLQALLKRQDAPEITRLLERVQNLQKEHEQIFDQGLEFRSQQTEPRIVGQFYQSKAAPLRDQMNDVLNDVSRLLNQKIQETQKRAEQAALAPRTQIPEAMSWFTALATAVVLSMALLVLKIRREAFLQDADRRRLFQEAQKALLSRDEVLSTVSSEFNEPLNVVLNTANKVGSQTENPSLIREGSDLIKSSVIVLQELIQNLMDRTKAEAGILAVRVEQLGIDVVLDEARFILQPLAKQKDIRLEIYSANPPVLAFFDRDRVVRVLVQLVGNAIKLSPRNSKIIVRVKSDQQFVTVSVKDQSAGIPEGQQDGLFEGKWQDPKVIAENVDLGLAVARTIIEAHGGTVSVESHPGSGSTFSFTLPRRRPAGANLVKSSAPVAKLLSKEREYREATNP